MSTDVQTCYRHRDRRAGVTCQRCNRPICPGCMHPASVGFHCPECTRTGRQRVYTARSLPGLNRPQVTIALIAVNVLVYGLLNNGHAIGGYGVNDLDLYGPAVADGEWWRLITAGFLHASVLHLLMNMFALWIFGSQLEPVLGKGRYLAAYGASLLAGSLGVMVLSFDSPTVGASGAIFGLLGVALVLQRSSGINVWQSGLGTIVVINLLITFGIPGISIGGHLGGLLGGIVCGAVIVGLGRDQKELAVAACTMIGAACFLVSMLVA